MGHRQLALIFALITAVIALLMAALGMMLGLPQGVSVIASIVMFNISSAVQMMIAKKKWELDYKNAFIMLLATSLVCSLVYTFGFQLLEKAFPDYLTDGRTHFLPFFLGNIFFRLPLDAVVAIFHKR